MNEVGGAPAPSRSVRRGRSLAVIISATLAVFVIALGGYWFLTRGPGTNISSPPGSTVATFKGSENQQTGAFQVREGWRIDWQHDSGFAFAIRGDRDFGTVIDEQESGSGVTSPVGAGTFHLEVSANGPWEIRVIQGN